MSLKCKVFVIRNSVLSFLHNNLQTMCILLLHVIFKWWVHTVFSLSLSFLEPGENFNLPCGGSVKSDLNRHVKQYQGMVTVHLHAATHSKSYWTSRMEGGRLVKAQCHRRHVQLVFVDLNPRVIKQRRTKNVVLLKRPVVKNEIYFSLPQWGRFFFSLFIGCEKMMLFCSLTIYAHTDIWIRL